MPGFYKGMMSPIVAQTPYNTLVFAVTERFKRTLAQQYPKMNESTKSLIGGSLASIVGALVYSPVELLKV